MINKNRIDEAGVKTKSKREMYALLASSGELYLPPMTDAHFKLINQLFVGEKKEINCFTWFYIVLKVNEC